MKTDEARKQIVLASGVIIGLVTIFSINQAVPLRIKIGSTSLLVSMLMAILHLFTSGLVSEYFESTEHERKQKVNAFLSQLSGIRKETKINLTKKFLQEYTENLNHKNPFRKFVVLTRLDHIWQDRIMWFTFILGILLFIVELWA